MHMERLLIRAPEHLSECFSYFYESIGVDSLSDLMFVCREGCVKMHNFVFSMFSPLLDNFDGGQFNSSNPVILLLSDYSETLLNKLRQLLYGRSVFVDRIECELLRGLSENLMFYDRFKSCLMLQAFGDDGTTDHEYSVSRNVESVCDSLGSFGEMRRPLGKKCTLTFSHCDSSLKAKDSISSLIRLRCKTYCLKSDEKILNCRPRIQHHYGSHPCFNCSGTKQVIYDVETMNSDEFVFRDGSLRLSNRDLQVRSKRPHVLPLAHEGEKGNLTLLKDDLVSSVPIGTVKTKQSNRLWRESKACVDRDIPVCCWFCNAPFETMIELNLHMRSKHGDQTFVRHSIHRTCNVCNAPFGGMWELRHHYKSVHELYRDDRLEVTGSAPASPNASEVRSVPLEVPPKSNGGGGHAENAMRPHKCGKCSKSFPLRCRLSLHLREVHEKKTLYTCQFCAKQFFKMSNLKRHELVHSSDKPFRCHRCNSKFKSGSGLSYHLKKTFCKMKENRIKL